MVDIVTFGEVLLRLKSPGYERFFQSPQFEATFGGAEANVANSLSHFGLNVAHVTALPDNDIAQAAVCDLRRYGVDTRFINYQGKRIGTYYLEAGASLRPGRVIYDRAHSSLSEAQIDDFNWDKILAGAKWFHTSGITPAISHSAAGITLDAMKTARKMGLTVSLDLNYRANLWQYGKTATEVMPELAKHADIIIAGREDCQQCLGVNVDLKAKEDISELDHFKALSSEMMYSFPGLKMLAITLRQSIRADYHRWSACLTERDKFRNTEIYDIHNIIDRVGGGDSFSAALIYGLHKNHSKQDALDFATAAGALKHSVPGDINLVTEKEVRSLMKGTSGGRVQR
ncbi:MAG: sugar kinase [Alphaproteobacteria bacterium]|nr:sugar kinase [Alphaproteobacteria bacterium]HPF47444.1 sugar kinase [Emcibacteraceae bacterium]HRW30580.1 sugar kinase [Emcibacteraceae bacterium]